MSSTRPDLLSGRIFAINSSMPSIEELNFAFLDVETTGLAAMYDDRVCEIGIVRTRGHDVTEKWDSLVNPERPISFGAGSVHGITDEMVAGSPKFRDVSGEILRLISDAVVVCHNAPFDISFIHSEFGKCGLQLPDVKVIDTLRLARRYFNFPSNSLGSIAYGLHIEMEQAHRALADASATQQVFSYMMKDLKKRGLEGIEKLYYRDLKISEVGIKAKQGILPPLLEEALKKKQQIIIKYISSAGVETERLLTPKEVLLRQDYAYLVAYCDLRKEDRTFRLDRILEIKIP